MPTCSSRRSNRVETSLSARERRSTGSRRPCRPEQPGRGHGSMGRARRLLTVCAAEPTRRVAPAAIRAAQVVLGKRVHQRGIVPASRASTNLLDLTGSVAAAQPNGEGGMIHRRPGARVKPILKRPEMFDPHRANNEDRLEAQPTITAVEVLAWPKQCRPARFVDDHLCSLEGMVRARFKSFHAVSSAYG